MFDWVLIFATLIRLNLIDFLTIIMKKSMQKYPILGWGLQYNGMFLRRNNKNKDLTYLTQMGSFYSSYNISPYCVYLLFPEGTDHKETTEKKSNDYATKMGLPLYS